METSGESVPIDDPIRATELTMVHVSAPRPLPPRVRPPRPSASRTGTSLHHARAAVKRALRALGDELERQVTVTLHELAARNHGAAVAFRCAEGVWDFRIGGQAGLGIGSRYVEPPICRELNAALREFGEHALPGPVRLLIVDGQLTRNGEFPPAPGEPDKL